MSLGWGEVTGIISKLILPPVTCGESKWAFMTRAFPSAQKHQDIPLQPIGLKGFSVLFLPWTCKFHHIGAFAIFGLVLHILRIHQISSTSSNFFFYWIAVFPFCPFTPFNWICCASNISTKFWFSNVIFLLIIARDSFHFWIAGSLFKLELCDVNLRSKRKFRTLIMGENLIVYSFEF